MDEYIAKAAVLIEALPYIQRFRGAVVVVKVGGSTMEDKEKSESALRDIVFMESVGMKPVIVHGGGKDISSRLNELGVPTRFVNGLRFTCDRSIRVVDNVLHNRVNPRLVNTIRCYGGHAQPLSGKDLLTAEVAKTTDPETGDKKDLGYVGEVVAVDASPILTMLEENCVPVITPLGRGPDGSVLNINADTSACRIAEALQARKLVFVSDVPGILADRDDETSVISTIRVDEVEGYMSSGVIAGGMVPKIRSAVAALRAGTNKVHLIDGRLQHSLLLEIFTDEGVGTQIVKE
jgi:acetylglutamate kinase